MSDLSFSANLVNDSVRHRRPLWGADAIGAELNLTPRQVRHLALRLRSIRKVAGKLMAYPDELHAELAAAPSIASLPRKKRSA